MSDFIIVNGDTVTFLPTFGAATVTPIPTTIAGTASKLKVTGKPACLEGDEKNVLSAGCTYLTPSHTIPGAGTLKIDKLGSDQLTSITLSEGKKVILHGSMFDAVFEVTSAAKIPPAGTTPAIDDTSTKYSGGKGMFVPTNAKVHAK